jgi:hypothetical protein
MSGSRLLDQATPHDGRTGIQSRPESPAFRRDPSSWRQLRPGHAAPEAGHHGSLRGHAHPGTPGRTSARGRDGLPQAPPVGSGVGGAPCDHEERTPPSARANLASRSRMSAPTSNHGRVPNNIARATPGGCVTAADRVIPARGTFAPDSCSRGTGSSDDARRELFAASDVALTGWRESLIAALNTPANQKT